MATGTTLSYALQSIIFLSCFTVGFSIECFQCNSEEHQGCSDLKSNDTNSQYYRKCDGNYQGQEPFCRKVATEIVNVANSRRIYRSCGWIKKGNLTTAKDFCRKADTDFIKKKQCQCSSDACNASGKILPSFQSIIAAVTVLNVLREMNLI